jgi:hypothetical protein
VSLFDPNHHDRVARLRQQLLDLLAGAENDPELFPDGQPEDEAEKHASIMLLNADALGGAMACTYLAQIERYSPQHARQWLAELLQILVKTIQKETGDDEVNFAHLGELADLMWTFRDEVPDHLPEDFDASP